MNWPVIIPPLLLLSPWIMQFIIFLSPTKHGKARREASNAWGDIEKGELEKAFEKANFTLKIEPINQYAHYVLGRYYTCINEPEEALKYFNRLHEIHLKGFALNFGNQSVSFREYNQYWEIAKLTKQIQDNPHDNETCLKIFRFYNQKYNFKKAKEVLVELLSNNPENYEGHFELGVLHYKQNRFTEAAKEFEWCLNKGQGEKEIYTYLGAALFKSKQFDKAIKAYEFYIQKFSANAETLYQLGRCYFELNDKSQAKEHFQKALNLEPNHFKAREYLKKL